MTPIKHPHCNDILRAPIGDENCNDLHIRREDGEVWSFWRPEPEELAAIVAGGTVALCVSGSTHPPLCVMAATPTEQIAVAEHAHVFSAAIDRRYQALLSITKRAIAAWTRETTERSRDHNRLTDEFLDLLTLNHGKGGKIVREVPVPQPETVQATIPENDAARYRADAEGWKEEAERWRATAEAKQTNIDWLNQQLANPETATATDGQRTTDAGGWMNYCLEAEQELAKARDAVRLLSATAQELNAVMNRNHPN